jgi:Holliday junction resolvasome RuvABC DNA-binding subunit
MEKLGANIAVAILNTDSVTELIRCSKNKEKTLIRHTTGFISEQ